MVVEARRRTVDASFDGEDLAENENWQDVMELWKLTRPTSIMSVICNSDATSMNQRLMSFLSVLVKAATDDGKFSLLLYSSMQNIQQVELGLVTELYVVFTELPKGQVG